MYDPWRQRDRIRTTIWRAIFAATATILVGVVVTAIWATTAGWSVTTATITEDPVPVTRGVVAQVTFTDPHTSVTQHSERRVLFADVTVVEGMTVPIWVHRDGALTGVSRSTAAAHYAGISLLYGLAAAALLLIIAGGALHKWVSDYAWARAQRASEHATSSV